MCLIPNIVSWGSIGMSYIQPGPNFMALLTVSTESAFGSMEYVLTASVFHGLAANLGFCTCVLNVTIGILYLHKSSSEIRRFHVSGESYSLAQNSAVSRAMNLGPGLLIETKLTNQR